MTGEDEERCERDLWTRDPERWPDEEGTEKRVGYKEMRDGVEETGEELSAERGRDEDEIRGYEVQRDKDSERKMQMDWERGVT
uniref:Uncharacterized protein n=1 Tax=Knipowitschia caucasica TaxID=637954 RepID=A0AAV2JHN8_KNICA